MNYDIFGIVTLLLVNVSSITLMLWVLKSSYKKIINQVFAIMVLFIILWVNLSYLGSNAPNSDLSTLYYRLNEGVVCLFIFIFYYFFTFLLLGIKGQKVTKYAVLVGSLLFAVLSVFTSLIISSTQITAGSSDITFGLLNDFLNIYAVSVALILFYYAVSHYSKILEKDKPMVKLFFAGTTIFIVSNIIFSAIVPLVTGITRFQHLGDFSFIFFLGFTAYAIIRHRLFDVKLTIVRSVTYVLVLGALVLFYMAFAVVLSLVFNNESSNGWGIVGNVTVSILLAFLIQPLRRFVDKVTDKIFYKDRYHTDDFYTRLNDALTINTNLRDILTRASHEIANTLKSEQAFFFINTNDGHYITVGTKHHTQLPQADALKISELCGGDYRAVAASNLEPDNLLQQLMLSHKIEIILPLVQSNKIVGYLCLGNNMSSGYSDRDMKILNMVSDEMVIAIQNALALQEILELNLTLQDKVAKATKELRAKNTQLRQLDKTKDEFVSVAAHELRTPMTVFRGFISILSTKQLGNINKKQKALLDKMSLNTKNLLDLVNNMLDLSKLEAGKLTIELSDNFLGDMVNRAIDRVSLLYEAKGLALNYTNVSVRVKTDPDKFERVLLNLLSNAYKFTPTGSVTISCKINEKDRMVLIGVTDTGIGMPADSISKLFKKFSQVDNYLQKTSDGTGLGLAICKQMVEKMGGKIWVESTVGVGSNFYFTMPMSDPLKTIH